MKNLKVALSAGQEDDMTSVGIQLKNVSKHYGLQWVIRNGNYNFNDNAIFGIKGPNGSGKSTLLQILSGYLSPSEGNVQYTCADRDIAREEIYRYLSMTAPYIDLIEEFNLGEVFSLSKRFGKIPNQLSWNDFLDRAELGLHQSKAVKNLSSGLLQRFKISLVMFSNLPVLILDEPTSYFDRMSKAWFYELLTHRNAHQKILIATNDPEDLTHCDLEIDIMNFK